MKDKLIKVLVGCKVYGVEVLGALWALYFLQETVCLIMFTPIQRGMSNQASDEIGRASLAWLE